MLRKLLPLLLTGSVLVYAWSGSKRQSESDPVFRQIDSIVKTLAAITGLSEQHAVPYGRMSQPQLRKFLARRIKKTLKPKEIAADELTLKMFGLVPANFDLKKSTVDLLTEQAAAFYDYKEKRLFLLDVSSFTSEETTLAHELSHALADQHFNLEKFVDTGGADDDEDLAHTAVVEGQASWLMLAYARRQQGLTGPPTGDQLATILQAGDSSAADYPVLQGSPLYIQQSLLFPYTEGTRFFDAVYNKLGQAAFTRVFSEAPDSSAEIYHPDLYFAHKKPPKLKAPKQSFEGGETELATGSLGEFDQRMLVTQFSGKSAALSLSPHALGSEYRIVSAGGNHKQNVLEYASEWDSNQSASDYFSVYKNVLRKKWRRCDPTIETATLFSGTGDTGYFVVKRAGPLVTTVEGIPGERDWHRIADK